MNDFTPKGYLIGDLTRGIYFKSENDISSNYLIELCKGKFEGNALVKIYTTDIPDNHFDTKGLINGCNVAFPIHDAEWCCEIDLCGKYFFPKFDNEMQLYYDDEKYYGGKCKTNSITSLFECINYAIEYGLKHSNITPY
jgi:hypothetical protein